MTDKCVLILGGGGMIGFQVAQRISRRLKPEKIIVASLYQSEIQPAVSALEKEFPDIQFIGFWGDVFVRHEYNSQEQQKHQSRNELLQNPSNRAGFFEDLFGDVANAYQRSQLVQLILTHRPDVIVDSINTATAISYQDIYSASQIARRDLDTLHDNTFQDKPAPLTESLDKVTQSFETLMISQYIPQLIRHVILLNKAMREAGTRIYLKVGTTGTGGMGLNIPYTHGEDKPSAKLMSKTAIAFAHTGLMFLMARTPPDEDENTPPIVKEIKPAAMVGYIDIAKRTISRGGKPAHIFTSKTESLSDNLTLQLDESSLQQKGQLQIPVVDTGENGVFARGEFEAITALRQMEFMTPEEIAEVVELEIRGVNTGKDVIAAVDGAIMGPTYRAGYLRHQALEELDKLEIETQTPSVALGELGPPELSKLLWEAYLLKQQFSIITRLLERSSEAVAGATPSTTSKRTPEEISLALNKYLQGNPNIQNIITSIGVPILCPDGETLLRGSFIRIPEVAGLNHVPVRSGDLDQWADKGWVDLRPKNMQRWIKRFELMGRAKQELSGKGSAAVDREMYIYDEIKIGEVVSWIFNTEMRGYRLK